MLFWLCLILTIIFALLANLTVEKFEHEWLFTTGLVGSFIFGIVALIMLIIIIAANTGAVGKHAALMEKHKALVYKAKTEGVRDELGLLNKEYIDEIQEWNVSIAKRQQFQRNFWIGIFYPDIYDDIETIDLNEIACREEVSS